MPHCNPTGGKRLTKHKKHSTKRRRCKVCKKPKTHCKTPKRCKKIANRRSMRKNKRVRGG